jgi:hypothetical protein
VRPERFECGRRETSGEERWANWKREGVGTRQIAWISFQRGCGKSGLYVFENKGIEKTLCAAYMCIGLIESMV